MSKINGSLKTLNFKYDFAIDGGAIGQINMGVFVPSGAMIMGVWARQTNPLSGALTSAGSAKVDIILTSGNTLVDNAAMGAVGTYVDYNTSTYGFLGGKGSAFPTIIPISLNGGLIQPTVSSQVQINIYGAAITGGSIIATIVYMDFFT